MSDYHIHTKPQGIQKVGRAAIRTLLPIASKIKYLVVTGQSGIVPGSIAAFTLGLDLVIIRKEGERSHGCKVEAATHFWNRRMYDADQSDFYTLSSRCCILDDFVAYGTTLHDIETALGFRPRFIALYRGDGDGPLDTRCQAAGIVAGPFTKLGRNLYRWESAQ